MPLTRKAKAFFFLLLAIYGVAGAFDSHKFQILNGANLLFHEAGHSLFSYFGQYVSIWGGTLLQLLFPAGLAIAFWIKGERCSSAVMAWWFGQNFFWISNYIKDARSKNLPLVGGEIHDWGFILGAHGLLAWDQQIASFVWGAGLLIVLSASLAGAWFALRHP